MIDEIIEYLERRVDSIRKMSNRDESGFQDIDVEACRRAHLDEAEQALIAIRIIISKYSPFR